MQPVLYSAPPMFTFSAHGRCLNHPWVFRLRLLCLLSFACRTYQCLRIHGPWKPKPRTTQRQGSTLQPQCQRRCLRALHTQEASFPTFLSRCYSEKVVHEHANQQRHVQNKCQQTQKSKQQLHSLRAPLLFWWPGVNCPVFVHAWVILAHHHTCERRTKPSKS